MDIERINKMEEALNECAAATAALDGALDRMEAIGERMTALFAYCGSAE